MKHTAYFNLVDAFKEEGCPVCHLIKKSIHQSMDSFLYESVNDPGTRKGIRSTLGYCNKHAWQLRQFGDGFGLSIIYQDLIEILLEKLTAIDGNAATEKSIKKMLNTSDMRLFKKINENCGFCKKTREVEERNIAEFLEDFREPELHIAFTGGFGLCLPHMLIAIDRSKDVQVSRDILKTESEKLKKLSAELKEFDRKHDYRFSGEGFGKEGNSWIRAIEKMIGKEGIF